MAPPPVKPINTNVTRQRTPSPVRPPVSPITPPLRAQRLPGDDRPTFTHTQQADQVGMAHPAPAPIDFEENPDVLALKSAISILQVQKARATQDIQTLSKVKAEALREPDEFLRDLANGKVKSKGPGFDVQSFHSGDTPDGEAANETGRADHQIQERSWSALPKPQNIVRCPPINWSQYAVVGESLDKLHSEQVQNPAQGAPATFNTGGTYQFSAGSGRQENYLGVAAPYAPNKDRVDRSAKSMK